jgi:hypothetical protein
LLRLVPVHSLKQACCTPSWAVLSCLHCVRYLGVSWCHACTVCRTRLQSGSIRVFGCICYPMIWWMVHMHSVRLLISPRIHAWFVAWMVQVADGICTSQLSAFASHIRYGWFKYHCNRTLLQQPPVICLVGSSKPSLWLAALRWEACAASKLRMSRPCVLVHSCYPDKHSLIAVD